MGLYFGTDGIRGEANTEVSPELAMKVGMAAALIIKKEKEGKPVFVIGRDTRLSGDMIESALTAGITSVGCDVLLAGIIPTPAIAYLTRTMDIDCGIVISASHNPFGDNGIKFFNGDGFKLTDEQEEEIEILLEEGESDDFKVPTGCDVGRVMILSDALQRYESYVESICDEKLAGFSVVMDCANGAAYKAAPDIFTDLGVKVVAFNTHPTGSNINENCGSTHPELLRKIMTESGLDAGFAFDGDADRLIVVDGDGETVDGDELMCIFARFYHDKGRLMNDKLVSTVMSNVGLELSMKEAGVEMLRSGVGDRKVLELMKKEGAILGGEQSGHIIFLDENTTGDGIISALKLLEVMASTGKGLKELKAAMKKYPQVLKNVIVEDKEGLMENDEFKALLKKREDEAGEGFRVLVRPSGTEPKIRVMAEGPGEEAVTKLVDLIVSDVEKYD